MELYENLWLEAVSAFQRGEPQIDPHLSGHDLRRGVTLVLRPSPAIRDAVQDYLKRLAAICPGQHYYLPEELHVTVLSVISGTEQWQNEIHQLDIYRAIIREVLSPRHSFKISFQGITATPGNVLVQGFPVGDGLAQIRNETRTAFDRAGFSGVLDRRYKISAAHMTVMRFRQASADWKRLLPLLEAGRQINFGEMEVTRLQLIWGDWYASAGIVRTLEEYRLGV